MIANRLPRGMYNPLTYTNIFPGGIVLLQEQQEAFSLSFLFSIYHNCSGSDDRFDSNIDSISIGVSTTSGGVKDACCGVESWNRDGVAVESGDVSLFTVLLDTLFKIPFTSDSVKAIWCKRSLSSDRPRIHISTHTICLHGVFLPFIEHWVKNSQEQEGLTPMITVYSFFCFPRRQTLICSCSTTHVLLTNTKSFPSFLAFCKTFIKVLLRFGLNLKEDKKKLLEKVVTPSEMN